MSLCSGWQVAEPPIGEGKEILDQIVIKEGRIDSRQGVRQQGFLCLRARPAERTTARALLWDVILWRM